MIVYFTPKKYDLKIIPTEAIPARRLATGQAGRESEVPVRWLDGQSPV
jgi:hypothetical protein